ncbi:ankyrin repeat and SAM domain-containing protein 3-like isoform X2 [Convolutriloba macropyga]|uniref:ankyrin repeat and SAM domain-containing protein 3-like isoform X2 n=1 Tax=Convolutriloba macropyga TaxID=536237 RepID=UPI003F525BAD
MFDFDPLETQDFKKKEVIWNEWMYGGADDPNFQPIALDLHTAASLGLYDAVRDLLKADGKEGKTHSFKNVGGWTPLMYASYIGHDTVLDLLLEAGADVTAVNRKGRTALMLACCCGNEAAAYTLIQAGANIEDMDYRGKSALFHAVSNGHNSLTRFMLESGANPNVKERLQGYTPLIEAAIEDQQLIVEALLEFGADWRPKLPNGHSARTLAMKYNNQNVVEMIDRRINEYQKRQAYGGRNALRTEDNDLLKLRGSDLRRSSSGSVVVNNDAVKPPCAKSPSIHEGPMSFAKMMSNTATSNKNPVERNNEDNDATIKNPDSSWSASNGRAVVASSTCNSNAGGAKMIRSNSVNHELQGQARLGERGNNAATILKASTDRLQEVIIQDTRVAGKKSVDKMGNDNVKVVEVRRGVEFKQGIVQYPYLQKQGSDSISGGHRQTVSPNATTPHQVPQHKHPHQFQSQPQFTPGLVGVEAGVVAEGGGDSHNLAAVLDQIQCSKWLPKFQAQDVDVDVFFTMTDQDLKEIGINLLGPRKKMTAAISRHLHSVSLTLSTGEQVYADKLHSDIEELNRQLAQANANNSDLKLQLTQLSEKLQSTSGQGRNEGGSCEPAPSGSQKLELTKINIQNSLNTLLKLRNSSYTYPNGLSVESAGGGGGGSPTSARGISPNKYQSSEIDSVCKQLSMLLNHLQQ